MLDAILLGRFEKRPGQQKILRGEFAIEEGITGRDIHRKYEFCVSFRPGQKIDMSMIFSEINSTSNHCPGCGAMSEGLAEIRIQWSVPERQIWGAQLKLL